MSSTSITARDAAHARGDATIQIQQRPRARRNQSRPLSSLPPLRKPKSGADPFRTLKIPKDAKYAHAKKAFLKIAMRHHPDTVGNDCEETQAKSREIFVRCRKALESLVECDDTGGCLLRSEVERQGASERSMSDEEFDSWFEEETGHHNPFQFDLDPSVMREVASMHDDMAGSHGLDRDGGMWHLASLISSAVKKGKDGAESVLKLEAGTVRPGENAEAKGKLSKRRKRANGRKR